MSKDTKLIAKEEIRYSLSYCNFFLRRIGLAFIDDEPKTFSEKFIIFVSFVTCSSLMILKNLGEYAYLGQMLMNDVTVKAFVGYLHIVGYDTISLGKLTTVWYMQKSFRQVVNDLADIWSVSETDPKAVAIKSNSLTSLRHRQAMFLFWNVLGVTLFDLTPVALHLYRLGSGMDSDLGYIWQIYYPFDKTKPFFHEMVYLFETFAGVASVSCTLASDMFFVTMANHISLLLRLLQQRIRQLGMTEVDTNGEPITKPQDCYDQIVGVIKIHQRLIRPAWKTFRSVSFQYPIIAPFNTTTQVAVWGRCSQLCTKFYLRYANDLEDAFSLVNLINVLLSSVNIGCVMFCIVFFESWMEMRNKFYLGAVITQIGIVCWYADDIYRASMGVSDAVYESGWYKCNTRCRRALLVMLQRSQKPLYFTALKFKTITMNTYTSILTTSYSYFTLLYTAYRRD